MTKRDPKKYKLELANTIEALREKDLTSFNTVLFLQQRFPYLSASESRGLIRSARELLKRSVTLREPDSVVQIGTEMWALVELSKKKGDYRTAVNALERYHDIHGNLTTVDYSVEDIALSLLRMLQRSQLGDITPTTLQALQNFAEDTKVKLNKPSEQLKIKVKAELLEELGYLHDCPIDLENDSLLSDEEKLPPPPKPKPKKTKKKKPPKPKPKPLGGKRISDKIDVRAVLLAGN